MRRLFISVLLGLFMSVLSHKSRAIVACVGDSITLGIVGTTNASVASYPAKLSHYLSHHKNYTVM